MKQTFYKTMLFLVAFQLFSSCKEEISPEFTSIEHNQLDEVNSFKNGTTEKRYYYKGKYNTLKVKNQNGVIHLEGEGKQIIDAAYEIPSLVTYIDLSDTSTVYLFDNYAEYDKTINKRKLKFSNNNSFTYTSISNSYEYTTPPPPNPPLIAHRVVRIFANSNYDIYGPNLGFYYLQNPSNLNNIEYPVLTSINNQNWDDVISSFHIDNACDGCNGTNYIKLVLYEHPHYGGKSLIFSRNPGFEGGITNLADYKISTFSSWRDKTSSFKILHDYAY